MKLLHNWGNFDLPKRMPEEHICLMPASCLSLINTHQGTRNKLLITDKPVRNLWTLTSTAMSKKGFLKQASPTLFLQSLSIFPFLPTPSRLLLRRLAAPDRIGGGFWPFQRRDWTKWAITAVFSVYLALATTFPMLDLTSFVYWC